MPPTSIPSSKRGWPNIRAITCTSPRPTLVGSTKSSAGLASLPNRQFAADPFAACVSWFLTSNVSSTTITPISAHSAGRLRPIPSSRRSNAYVKLFMGQYTRIDPLGLGQLFYVIPIGLFGITHHQALERSIGFNHRAVDAHVTTFE